MSQIGRIWLLLLCKDLVVYPSRVQMTIVARRGERGGGGISRDYCLDYVFFFSWMAY